VLAVAFQAVAITAAGEFWWANRAVIRAVFAVLKLGWLAYPVVIARWQASTVFTIIVRLRAAEPIVVYVVAVGISVALALLPRIELAVPTPCAGRKNAVGWLPAAVTWAGCYILIVLTQSIAAARQIWDAQVAVLRAKRACLAAPEVTHAVAACTCARAAVLLAGNAVLPTVGVACAITARRSTVLRAIHLRLKSSVAHTAPTGQAVSAILWARVAVLAGPNITPPIATDARVR
jgi:hypothetical protein